MILMAAHPVRIEAEEEANGTASRGAQESDVEADLSGGTTEGSFGFEEMRVRVGDRIQLQPPATVGPDRYIVKLIGYLDRASLLVTAPTLPNGLRVQFREGDKIVARVFSSQKAFAFDCKIERICKLPYPYLHLSFPDVIQGAVIRKSPRIRTQIIVSVGVSSEESKGDRQPGIIANLSADGALVKTRQFAYQKGQTIHLSFRITLHDIDAYMSATAIVCNMTEEEGKEEDVQFRYQHGLQFLDLTGNDRLILQSLIYKQMIEQPQTLT
ncbi:MAG: flagellar brake protein [Paucimonas sp.]|nr:flagellar brake protein [Paucimonas sp.]